MIINVLVTNINKFSFTHSWIVTLISHTKVLCGDAVTVGTQSLSIFELLLFPLIASYKSPLGPISE